MNMNIEQIKFWASQYPTLVFAILAVLAVVGVVTVIDPRWLWLRRSLRADRDRAATHGSARWAEQDEIEALGLMHDGKTQMILGDFGGRYVGAPVHALVCAPTGSGKGVGIVLPTLLSYRGSIVCNDPKGENLSISARWRESIGQEIVALDPWGKGTALCGRESCRVNPLAYIDKNSLLVVTRVKQLVRAICGDPIEGGQNSFFYSAAEDLITFFLLFTVIAEKDDSKRNLVEVRKLVLSTPEAYKEVLDKAMQIQDCRGELATMATSILSICFSSDSDSLDFSTTFKSVLGNAKNNLEFLSDLQLQDFFSDNTYDLRNVQAEPTSVYVIVDPSKTAIASVFTRICYATIILPMLEVQSPDGLPVILLIDELVKLGKFKLIEETISIIRDNGARYLLIIQNMQQLKSCYGHGAEDIEENAQLVAFSPSTAESQQHLSRRLGNQTIDTYTINDRGQKTKSKTSKPLMSPEELGRMDNKTVLIFPARCSPVRARHIKYYADKRFAGRYDPKKHDLN